MGKLFQHSLLILPLALIFTESLGEIQAIASDKSELFEVEVAEKIKDDWQNSQVFLVQSQSSNHQNHKFTDLNRLSEGLLALEEQINSNDENGESSQENFSNQEESSSKESSPPENCPLPPVKALKEEVMKIPVLSSEGIPYEEIRVTGNTVFSEVEINKTIRDVIKPDENELDDTSPESKIARAIANLYTENGYLLVTQLENTKFVQVFSSSADGKIEITINEEIASIKKIKLQGRERLNLSYICGRILLARMTPFNIRELEDQLKLLRVDPLFNYVEAKLGIDNKGEQTLTVVVEEAPLVGLTFGIDNYSPPSLGGERFGIANLQFRNITGLGDQISTSYYHTISGGADVLDIAYRVPLNPMNGSLQFRVSPNWQRITQAPFDQLGIAGDREYYEITYRQPLWRSIKGEFALSLGFTYQDGQTFLFDNIGFPFAIGPDEDGVSRTSVIKFGQDYISRDQRGSWSMRSQFNFGTGLFDATINDSPIPDGLFFSWLGQAQRVQILNDDHLLIIQADLQLTPDGLLPTERFVIGGGQSVRGYRQNVRSGDNGFRFSIEDRITVVRDAAGAPTIQLAPFLDMGSVWNAGDNPNLLLPQRFLIGGGLGFLWDGVLGVEGLSLRFDYGFPFIDLDDRGNNIQDDGLYFRINYRPFR